MTGATCTNDHLQGARAWLAVSAETSAAAAADRAFADLGEGAAADLAQRIETAGLTPLLAWADLVALAGLATEPWVREAALRAVRAYAGRLAELIDGAGRGGRS